jgi:hypothetical protein
MSFSRTRLGRVLIALGLTLALALGISGVASQPAQAATKTMTVFNKGKCVINVGASYRTAKGLKPGKSRKIRVNSKTGPVIALATGDKLVVTNHGTGKSKKTYRPKGFKWQKIGYRKGGKDVKRTASNGKCRVGPPSQF